MRYVALLRGINVGGNKMVAMADLRTALTTLGFTEVSTLLQSGNVVFTAPKRAPAKLEAAIEKAIATRFKLQVDVHVRDAAEWAAAIAANPFAAEARSDPGHLLVTFYRDVLDKGRVQALQSAIAGREKVACNGRHLYMTFPDGVGNSKATVLADRTLGVKGTARNWNTVLKLAAVLGS